MKYVEPNPYADPEKAARRLMEVAHAVEPVQDGRIHIEKINYPFLFQDKAKPAEYGAGLKLAIERGWLLVHDSGNTGRSRRKAPSHLLRNRRLAARTVHPTRTSGPGESTISAPKAHGLGQLQRRASAPKGAMKAHGADTAGATQIHNAWSGTPAATCVK
jgi:hypothetical protein